MGRDRLQEGKRSLSRRGFLGSAAAAASFAVVSAHVLGGSGKTSPNEKLNIAGVGVGGRGHANLSNMDTENIVALCDVDKKYAARTLKKYPHAQKYTDYRRMLDEMGDRIDAVMVGTPDHSHAAISIAAMDAGMHVYCEKPLTHTVWEARQVMRKAKQSGVVTQMGNQGHSGDLGEGTRSVKEWIDAGVIGPVREVHCWQPSVKAFQKAPKKADSLPKHLEWGLWCQPLPRHTYSPSYHPSSWRGWWNFGTGTLGDFGCHHMDAAYWALDLKNPARIEACSTRVTERRVSARAVVRYEFPATQRRGPVTLYWYHGKIKPPRPREMEAGRSLRNTGVLFVGEEGFLQSGHCGENPVLIPLSRMKDFEPPPKTIPRVKASHQQHWIRCCKEGVQANSNFAYAAPLTETVLLGTVAIRVRKPIEWDGENMVVTNVPEANTYLRPRYRKGFSL